MPPTPQSELQYFLNVLLYCNGSGGSDSEHRYHRPLALEQAQLGVIRPVVVTPLCGYKCMKRRVVRSARNREANKLKDGLQRGRGATRANKRGTRRDMRERNEKGRAGREWTKGVSEREGVCTSTCACV